MSDYRVEEQMRAFETVVDSVVPDSSFIIVRIDGRGFTRLIRSEMQISLAFSTIVRDAMLDMMRHVIQNSGFHIIYATTHSDEGSFLLHPKDVTFKRRVGKILSTFASESSSALSLALRRRACFDARLSVLPSVEYAGRYFAWRSFDCLRNSISTIAYWKLIESGATAKQADKELSPLSLVGRARYLASLGITTEKIPLWQKRGIGFSYNQVKHIGENPRTKQKVPFWRNVLTDNRELPPPDELSQLVSDTIRYYLD